MKNEYLDKNKNINRGFRKLEIWKNSVEVYHLIHEYLMKNGNIPLKVKAQIEDSALSLSSNIAEGYSRRSLKETVRFYEYSLASSAENYSQMYTLFNAGQITENDFNEYDSKLYEFENGLIKLIRGLVARLKSGEEWRVDYITQSTNHP